MATDDALLTLRDAMRDHRRRLASSAFSLEDLIRAVDQLLEMQELNLEGMVGRLVRARQQDQRVRAGAIRQKRRRKPVH